MLQQLVKAYFIGQVLCEEAVEAIQKQKAVVCEKKEELQHKACEFKSEKLFDKTKFEAKLKENLAGLRKGFKSFDQACYSLSQLLVESDELKASLISNDVSAKELVHT